MKERFVQVRGCQVRRIPVPDAVTCCPKCGGTFDKGVVILDLVLKEQWIEQPVKWWKPSTWNGGHWKLITTTNKH